MARRWVEIVTEDPTVCVVCCYPAAACICEEPERLRREEMLRVRRAAEWLTVILDGARQAWARLKVRGRR